MEREDIAKNLGNNIKRFRLEKGFSQENLALRAGIHPAYLGRLEEGKSVPLWTRFLKSVTLFRFLWLTLLLFPKRKTSLREIKRLWKKSLKGFLNLNRTSFWI